MTVTFTVQDNADNESGRRLQRSTDGGSTWTTVDDVGANETTLIDPDPPLFEPVRYRSQVHTEHVVSNSASVTIIPIRPETMYAELGAGDAPTVVAPGDWTQISISPEHTGLWGADLTVAPADRVALDYALTDLQLFYGSDLFFDGECRIPQISTDDATATLQSYGKMTVLETNTDIVSYPGALVDSGGIALYEAIEDYWSRTAVSATVYQPDPTAISTDELFFDAPDPTAFTNFISVPDDLPIDVQATTIKQAPVRFFAEAEHGSGSGTVVDSVDAPSDHSNFEAVELSAAGAKREIQFTPAHDIPWEDFIPRVRYEFLDFDGYIYLTLDGQRIGVRAVGGPATESAQWAGTVNLEALDTVDSPPADPLEAGTSYSFGIEVDEDANGNFGGSVFVDCFAPGDSGDRFGGYSITEDNTVDTDTGTIDGPQRFDQSTTVAFDVDEVWRVSESTVDITIDDTSGDQALTQRINTGITASNTTSQTVDWDAQSQYGTTVTVEPTLARYTDDSFSSPATGDATQTITGLEVRVDTDDTSVIEAANPVTLDADTHLENLQTLHEHGDYRFVADHSVEDLVVESFRRGDPQVAKPSDWTTEATGTSEERDTRDYANRTNAVGDGVDVSIIHTAEVDRVGQEVPDSISRPNISDYDKLVDEARNELLRRVGNDERTGSLSIAPHLVLPGYPYTVEAFGGEQANLNSVQISFGADGGSGDLQFGRLRTLARRLSEAER